MIARLYSAALIGVDALEVEVEVDGESGESCDTSGVSIVGLPDAGVKESFQRVNAAINNSGLTRGFGYYIINLAPANLRKQGPSFDLPIALGILLASQRQNPLARDVSNWSVIGELALDGQVRAVRGILAVVIEARRCGRKAIMVPQANACEASVIEGIDVYAVSDLNQAWQLLLGQSGLQPQSYIAPSQKQIDNGIDFSDVKGQLIARRAMEIAAAGMHNILICGAPGSGKSMLAERLPTIMPELQEQEAIETSKIHSVCGKLVLPGLLQLRPFRSPHHTISEAGLMGGGSQPQPGEVSLAHNGILFLDELPEFKRQTLENMRQPLETGQVVIARAQGTYCFPCRFMLVAAMNPCPCGYAGDYRRKCNCTPQQILNYRNRISGPLLDRFDIIIQASSLQVSELTQAPPGECSEFIKTRVLQARQCQLQRYRQSHGNAQMSSKDLKRYAILDEQNQLILARAIDSLSLSARGHDRILRVARTIADLAGENDISREALQEAISLRRFEAKMRCL